MLRPLNHSFFYSSLQSMARVTWESEDDIFLGIVNASANTFSPTGSSWVVNLTLNGHPVQFKIDTGANVTVIGETDYDETLDLPLQSSRTTLSDTSQMSQACLLCDPCPLTKINNNII